MIAYDRNQPLVSFSTTPWLGAPLAQWFDNYQNISCYDWNDVPADAPPTITLGYTASWPDESTQIDLFERTLREYLPPTDILGTRPISINRSLQNKGYSLYLLSPAYWQQYEDKAYVRGLFRTSLPFPQFTIYKTGELEDSRVSFRKVAAGRKKFVMQGAQSKGGRATSIIEGFEDYRRALLQLQKQSKIVVSEFIVGALERSMQCILTNESIILGPVQKQIISDPQLSGVTTTRLFDGGEVGGEDIWSQLHPQMRTIAHKIAEHFQRRLNYRGVLGVDFLVDKNGYLYVLEVNPRITRMTYLFNQLWQEGGFLPYLVHALERLDRKYTLSGVSSNNRQYMGGMLVLRSHHPVVTKRVRGFRSGVYSWNKQTKQLSFVASSCRLASIKDENDFLMVFPTPDHVLLKPKGLITELYFKRHLTTPDDNVLPEIKQIVAAVYRNLS